MNLFIVFLLLEGEKGGGRLGGGHSLVMLCIDDQRLKYMLTAAVLLQLHRKTLHGITRSIDSLTRIC